MGATNVVSSSRERAERGLFPGYVLFIRGSPASSLVFNSDLNQQRHLVAVFDY